MRQNDYLVGSKGGAGIAQWIISQMPVHRTYVEAFLGKGVILRTKLSAARNIGIEVDPKVISRFWIRQPKTLEIFQADALALLPALKLDGTALVYADPPYLGSARGQANRSYYNHELLSQAGHERLLSVLTGLQAMVLVSGYASRMYDEALRGWRKSSKWTVTRGGRRVQEWLWMNFDPPALIHDTRFIGDDFTDRQAIKRKIARWKKKFLAMPPGVRFAILEALTGAADVKNCE